MPSRCVLLPKLCVDPLIPVQPNFVKHAPVPCFTSAGSARAERGPLHLRCGQLEVTLEADELLHAAGVLQQPTSSVQTLEGLKAHGHTEPN